MLGANLCIPFKFGLRAGGEASYFQILEFSASLLFVLSNFLLISLLLPDPMAPRDIVGLTVPKFEPTVMTRVEADTLRFSWPAQRINARLSRRRVIQDGIPDADIGDSAERDYGGLLGATAGRSLVPSVGSCA